MTTVVTVFLMQQPSDGNLRYRALYFSAIDRIASTHFDFQLINQMKIIFKIAP
ncbi:hypothetical protein pah_c014o091 [Parachlamydia acanthamoebae str. Hall's coccus]|jgi:hypothetical protein|nr:hypothetical protein pah_c014o091 [Parachlamydia acanthamoebae str. Hall's coccus]